MNQRRRLLNQARKGDLKAINRLFELYQVRVYSGDNLKKVGRGSFIPPPVPGTSRSNSKGNHAARKAAAARRRVATRNVARKVASRKASRSVVRKPERKLSRRSARR